MKNPQTTFCERVRDAGGSVEVVRGLEEAAAKAAEKAVAHGGRIVYGVRLWKEIADSLEEALAERGLRFLKVDPLTLVDPSAVGEAEVSVGAAELGIAESGTIVYFARAAVEEAAIFASETHISILNLERILESPSELEREAESALARGLSVFLLTGPSCTADVEGEIIRGVHGSQNLHVILLEEV